jgi:molybdopterin converting factor small subunit
MGRVKLVIRPWLSHVLDATGPEPLLLEKEIKEGATLGSFLKEIAASHPAFAEAVFDAEGKNLSGRISIVLNDHILGLGQDLEGYVKDGDTIMLLPTISGG